MSMLVEGGGNVYTQQFSLETKLKTSKTPLILKVVHNQFKMSLATQDRGRVHYPNVKNPPYLQLLSVSK